MNRPPVPEPCFLLADGTNGEERRERRKETGTVYARRGRGRENERGGRIAQYAFTFPSTKVPRACTRAESEKERERERERAHAMISSRRRYQSIWVIVKIIPGGERKREEGEERTHFPENVFFPATPVFSFFLIPRYGGSRPSHETSASRLASINILTAASRAYKSLQPLSDPPASSVLSLSLGNAPRIQREEANEPRINS